MMKKVILLITVLIAANTVFSQTDSHYKGNEKDCPYLHPENKYKKKDANLLIIDDFESSEKTVQQWMNGYESGDVKSSITTSKDAKEGKKAAILSFTGKKSKDSWTNLYCKTTFDAEHSIITFWAKAPKKVMVKLTITQGKGHNVTEMYGYTFTITKEWKLYHVRLSEVDELIFSHLVKEGKYSPAKVINSKVTGVGFSEINFPTTFVIDELKIY